MLVILRISDLFLLYLYYEPFLIGGLMVYGFWPTGAPGFYYCAGTLLLGLMVYSEAA